MCNIQNVDAGTVNAEASMNGKVVAKGTTLFRSTSLKVTAPSGDKIDITVHAQKAPKDSIMTLTCYVLPT